MFGLSVRWSLRDADPAVAQELRDYVREQSLARFTGMPGLSFKTWRMVPGEWFEGTYVWDTARDRDQFLVTFQASADTAPGTVMIGSEPVLYEMFEVVAVAEGEAGFASGPGPG